MKRQWLVYLCFILLVPSVYGQEAVAEAPRKPSVLEMINSDMMIRGVVFYEVKPGDTLGKIAGKFKTTQEMIRKRNHLSDHKIKAGEYLAIWSRPFNIEVNKTTNELFLKIDEHIIKRYRVSTGKADSITPVGEFTIKSRYPNPTWFHKGEVVPGGDPKNWLGTRWLGFDKPKYGIHGTIYPELIGQSVSGGCVRMKNSDIEELYDVIPVGTKVVIKEEDVIPGAQDAL